MDEQEFWSVIALLDWSETGEDDAVLAPAIAYLSEKSDEDILQFHEILARLLYEIDGAAWAENMGDAPIVDGDPFYSPDEFLAARCCAVANGQSAYFSVLENPDNMPRDMGFEPLLYLAERAWAQKHQGDADSEEFFCDTEYDYESFSNEALW